MPLFACNALCVTVSASVDRPHLPVFACRIFGINLAQHKITMKIICAWCEQEGKETLIGEVGLYDWQMTSHGICEDHEQVIWKQIEELRIKQNPRLRRRRPSRAKSRASSPLPASLTTCIRTPTRRRLRKDRLSSAQLCLPFNEG
jgi:hypothetical protein